MSSSYAQAANLDCFRVLIPVLTPRTDPNAIMDFLNKQVDEGVASSELAHAMASEAESPNGYPLFEAVQTAIVARIPHHTTEQQTKDLPNLVGGFWSMLRGFEQAEWELLAEDVRPFYQCLLKSAEATPEGDRSDESVRHAASLLARRHAFAIYSALQSPSS